MTIILLHHCPRTHAQTLVTLVLNARMVISAHLNKHRPRAALAALDGPVDIVVKAGFVLQILRTSVAMAFLTLLQVSFRLNPRKFLVYSWPFRAFDFTIHESLCA